MVNTMRTITISAQSHNVRQHLLNLIDLSKGNHSSLTFDLPSAAVVDCLERFSLWAGNMGAMHNPLTSLSLDQRLLQATDIRQQIHRQLDEIEESIVDLTSIIRSPSPNSGTAIDRDVSWSVVETSALENTTEDSLDEAKITLQIIHECINSLFRLSMLIRKLSPRDRFKQSLLISDLAFPNLFDIDYVRNKYSKLANSPLSIRLGSGIAKRRNFIRYCRDHRSRLGMEESNIHDTPNTEPQSSKATTFAPPLDLSLQEEEADNISLVNASTTATFLSNLTLPSLVDLAPTDQPFECPICYTIQTFQNENSWKLHAFRDLKAYVCTLGGAECDAELFEDRDSWFEHELQTHRSQYSCVLCNSRGFSIIDLQAHILQTHGHLSDAQLTMLQEEGREIPTQFEAQDCPFCDEWAEKLLQKSKSEIRPLDSVQGILVNHYRFKRHVASHQEQLAIFAVPRANEDEGSPDSVSIILSDATPTAIEVDEDEMQENDVERDNVLQQNIEETPPDVSGSPNTTDKDDILSKQERNVITEVKHSKETKAIDTLSNASEVQVRNPSSDASIPNSQDTLPVKDEQNRALQQKYKQQTLDTWTCCRCGMGGMVCQTTRQCLEASCQHQRCAHCTYFYD